MAGAEVIGAAISIMLLIIVGYAITGSILQSAETITDAQKDVAQSIEQRLHTNIEITNATIINESYIEISLKNSGQEPITDFKHMDIQTYNKINGYEKNSWILISQSNLNPGDSVYISARYTSFPDKVMVITGNGISATHKF